MLRIAATARKLHRRQSQALGDVLTFTYDAADRITKTTYPDTTSEQRTYHFLDLASFKDRLARTTSFTYDANRQLTEIEDPLTRSTTFEYCSCGAISQVTDALGNPTSFDHDVENRLIAKHFADGSSVEVAYENTTSRVKTRTDPLGQSTNFSYNKDDTLAGIDYTNEVHATPSVGFTWDTAFQRILSMADGTGTTSFAYKAVTSPATLGATRLSTVTGPVSGDVITLQYDALGRVSQRVVAGTTSSQTLDKLDRLDTATNPLGIFTMSYLQNSGLPVRISSPNGPVQTRTYFDHVGHHLLKQIVNQVGGSTVSEFDYTYNAVERVTRSTEPLTSRVNDYTYDAADQLLSASLHNSTPLNYSYLYDFAANRTRETIDGVVANQTFNTLNEVSSAGASYDANGNPISLGGKTFEWDAADRVTAVTVGTHRTELAYDGFGRRTRVTEKDNGAVTSDRRYLWCGLELCQERDALQSNAVTKRYFPQGVQVSGVAYYYTTDGQGSVRELLDATGAIRAVYHYDPYGRRTSCSASAPIF